MRKSKTHKATSLTFSLEKNLEDKNKIFFHMHGNSQAAIITQDSALNFANWLRDLADLIDGKGNHFPGWADEVENG